MIERRITFIIGDEGIPSWKLNLLKTLAGYFRAVVVMQNVTRLCQANAEQPVRIMSLGCMPGDLCQLLIEGSDAELACMVLTDFVAEQFLLVKTSGKKKNRNACSVVSSDKANSAFYLPFDMAVSTQTVLAEQISLIQPIEVKEKMLSRLCQMLNLDNPTLLLELMLEREQVSSTCMGAWDCVASYYVGRSQTACNGGDSAITAGRVGIKSWPRYSIDCDGVTRSCSAAPYRSFCLFFPSIVRA